MFVSMQIYEFLSKSQPICFFLSAHTDVCLYANIRIFKQITTSFRLSRLREKMFVSMQIYEFLSKSQLNFELIPIRHDVCLYANIRIFKQITTGFICYLKL